MNFADGKYKTRNGAKVELRNYVAIHNGLEYAYDRDGNVKYFQEKAGDITPVKGPHDMDLTERIDWRVKK